MIFATWRWCLTIKLQEIKTRYEICQVAFRGGFWVDSTAWHGIEIAWNCCMEFGKSSKPPSESFVVFVRRIDPVRQSYWKSPERQRQLRSFHQQVGFDLWSSVGQLFMGSHTKAIAELRRERQNGVVRHPKAKRILKRNWGDGLSWIIMTRMVGLHIYIYKSFAPNTFVDYGYNIYILDTRIYTLMMTTMWSWCRSLSLTEVATDSRWETEFTFCIFRSHWWEPDSVDMFTVESRKNMGWFNSISCWPNKTSFDTLKIVVPFSLLSQLSSHCLLVEDASTTFQTCQLQRTLARCGLSPLPMSILQRCFIWFIVYISYFKDVSWCYINHSCMYCASIGASCWAIS